MIRFTAEESLFMRNCREGRLSDVESSIAAVDKYARNAGLIQACEFGRTAVAKLLISNGADQLNEALLACIHGGPKLVDWQETVGLLIESGADDFECAAAVALQNGHQLLHLAMVERMRMKAADTKTAGISTTDATAAAAAASGTAAAVGPKNVKTIDDDKSDLAPLEELLVLGGAAEPSTLLQRLAMQMVYRRPTNIPEWSAVRKTRTFQLGSHNLERSTSLCGGYRSPNSTTAWLDSDDDSADIAPKDMDLVNRAQAVFVEQKTIPRSFGASRTTDLQSIWSMAAAVQLSAADPEAGAFRFAPFWISDATNRSLIFPAYAYRFSSNGNFKVFGNTFLDFVVDDPRRDERLGGFVDNADLNGPVGTHDCGYIFDEDLLNDTVVSTASMPTVVSAIRSGVGTAGFVVQLAEIVVWYLQLPAIPQVLKDAVPKPRQ